MKVYFFDNISYQTYPEVEGMIEMDEEVLKQIGVTKQYVNGEVIDYNVPAIENRIVELKQLLENTDFKTLKFAEGEITSEEFEPIKAQRKAWRDEINLLEEQLKQLTNS